MTQEKPPKGKTWLRELFLYYSWTILFADLQSLSRNMRHINNWTRKVKSVQTVPWKPCLGNCALPTRAVQTTLNAVRKTLLRKTCYCMESYGGCPYSVRNRTESVSTLYRHLRNCMDMYEQKNAVFRNLCRLKKCVRTNVLHLLLYGLYFLDFWKLLGICALFLSLYKSISHAKK